MTKMNGPEEMKQIVKKALIAPAALKLTETSSSEPCYTSKMFLTRAKRFGLSDLHVANLVGRKPHLKSEEARTAIQTAYIGVLLGPRGTGKTQIAHDILADRIMSYSTTSSTWPGQPRYVKISDIFREIRATFRRESPLTEVDVVRSYVEPRTLVIDEAHERGETDFENRSLTHIVDKRYDAQRETILIANLTREKFADAMGPSITSRIHEVGTVVVCDWPSFREKKS